MVTAELWAVAVLSLILLALVVGVEETRVQEAHREADSWRKRTCQHGSTPFQPFDGDERSRS